MNYMTELQIDLSLEKTIELFDSSENLKKWQQGLLSIKPLGEEAPGQDGAKTQLVYKMKNREVIMEEEIIENKLPDYVYFIFRSTGVINHNKNYFSSTNEGHTLWRQENDFKMKGLLGLMGFIAPWMFKKQTLSDMKRFKNFAEKMADENKKA